MPRLLIFACAILRKIAQFRSHEQGNVAILLGLSLIPLIGIIGLGTDYGVALTDKTKLDNAADSAALAAVATAKAYIANNQTDQNLNANAIAAGLNQASRAFTVNMGNLPFATVPVPQTSTSAPPSTNTCGQATACIYLTKTGQTFTSRVYYKTATQNHFGQLFGSPTMNVQGTSGATTQIPSYLDFYLMIDVSGSMGLPATQTDMANLAAVNRDMYSDYQQGCQFACHFPGFMGWTLAAGKIQLRSDAVNNAVCSLLQKATNTALVSNQYRIGFYPFINQLATLSAISSNLTALSTVAQCNGSKLAFTNLLDTGTTQLSTNGDPSTGTGSGGTHFEVAFPQMQAIISPYGDGSSASNSRPFVFLITDGMENNQHFYTWTTKYTYPGNVTMNQPNPLGLSFFPGYNAAWWDGSQPSQIDASKCAALKSAGATISILYIPYNIIQFVNNGGGVAWENNQVNSFSPTLATPLQSCASPGFFYTANSPTDITNALNAMFNQALQVAHLTQ